MFSTLGTIVLTATLVVPHAGATSRPGDAFTRKQLAATVLPLKLERAAVPVQAASQERSKAKRAMWAAIGGVGGFFGGGYLGAAIEPDCNCDDPGFKGFLIGAPIGAATGAILGWVFGR